MEILKQGTEDNIKWTLTDDGTLIISGEGDMPDWNTDMSIAARTPWYRHNCLNSIKKVIIEPGITSIGRGAFDRCRELVEIVLPEGIITIGDYAFYECDSLSDITLPNSLLHIGDSAFGYCYSLQALALPDSLKTLAGAFIGCGITQLSVPPKIENIVPSTFLYCQSLEEIYIPASVKEIKDDFEGCNELQYINVAQDNEDFTSENGILFNKDMTKLLRYPPKKSDERYTIPETVIEISTFAFDFCCNLVDIYITKNVSGELRFSRNGRLKNIIVSEDNPHFTSEDGVLFNKDKSELIQYPCAKKGAYKIPDYVKEISYPAFSCVYGLTDLYINENIAQFHIPDEAPVLKNIRVSEDNPELASINGVLFNKAHTVLYYYPTNRQNKYYRIPSSARGIRATAFCCCNNLESLFIPRDASFFPDWHLINFSECPKLKSISVDRRNCYYSSKDGILYNKSKSQLIAYPQNKRDEEYYAPPTLNYFGSHAFFNNKHIKSIYITRSVIMDIGDYAFEGCDNLEKFDFLGSNFIFSKGTLWNLNNHQIIWDKKNDYRKIWQVWITNSKPNAEYFDKFHWSWHHLLISWKHIRYSLGEDGVLTIEGEGYIPECFIDKLRLEDDNIHKKIKKVIIKGNIYRIGNYAFENCSAMTEISLSKETNNIDSYAFNGCSSLKNIVFPTHIESIGECAFCNCTALEEVQFPKRGEWCEIAAWAFENCSSLKKINFPQRLLSIESDAFDGCHSLVELNIPKHTNSILRCFDNCDSLERINVAPGNEYYSSEDGVLYNKDKSELILYPPKKSEEILTLPDATKQITYYAFGPHIHLKELHIGSRVSSAENIHYIPTEAIIVSDKNPYYKSVDGVLFDKDTKTLLYYPSKKTNTEYSIPSTTKSIGECAFANNSTLKTIKIPASVEKIYYDVFRYCESLENIELDEKNKHFKWKDGMLWDCNVGRSLWKKE